MTLEENLRRIDELALAGQDLSDCPYRDELIYTEHSDIFFTLCNHRTPRRDFYKTVEQTKELLPKLYCQPEKIVLVNDSINLIYIKQTRHEKEYILDGMTYTNQKLYIEISTPYTLKITFDDETTEREKWKIVWESNLEKEMEIPLHEINTLNTVIKNFVEQKY